MSGLWTRGRIRLLAASGIAAILVAAWVYRQSGLSWVTIVVTIIAAGCVAAMVYLWWVSDRTTKTLDALQSGRDRSKSETKLP